MRMLLTADQQEAGLSAKGGLLARYEYLRILSNRLCIQASIDRHPEILQIPVQSPVFILGLPRTGTTLLHHLLAQDPGNRAPLMWEMLFPAPPSRGADWRTWQTKAAVLAAYTLMPRLRPVHAMQADGPEECMFLLANEFASLDFAVRRYIPSYIAWYFRQEATQTYESYRRQLQLVSWSRPAGRWILKSPYHLPSLRAVLQVFPDAYIVQTHRHPSEVIPSICSLVQIVRDAFSRQVDRGSLGAEWTDIWGEALTRAMRDRNAASTGRFIDVDYRELVSDPLRSIRSLYDRLGQLLSAETEIRMREWLHNNPQNKHGRHRYTLEEFSLDRELIHHRFSGYIDRFGL